MKKALLAIMLLTCIVTSMFALSATIYDNSVCSSYRVITVYDDNGTKVLEYRRPYVLSFNRMPLASLYSISWYKEGSTAEQIREWKEFAKLFVEEEK